ncbi:MAG: cytochrome-c peroxidase [Luteibaculum sp.]
MKTIIKIFGLSLIATAVLSCRKDPNITQPQQKIDQDLANALIQHAPNSSLQDFVLPDEGELAAFPADPRNPISQAKVELGKMLFHETGLGVDAKFDASKQKFSCASCHHAQAGFQAGVQQGLSDGGIGFGFAGEGRKKDPNCPEDSLDVQPIRSPSILNTAYQEVTLWNGQFGATGLNQGTESSWTPGTPKEVNKLGFQGIEIQAIAGQAVHRLNVNATLFDNSSYQNMFKAAYGNLPKDELYTKEKIGLAIAAYERTVVANEAPFQKWLKGQKNAMTEKQKQGAILFFGKAGCGSCHKGPALNSMAFHAYGMNDFNDADVFKTVDEATKKGRGGFTGRASDNYKFKVPQLYNLTQSPFYGHGGSFRSVEAVVRYKNAGVAQNPIVPASQLSPAFRPLGLSEDEIKAITAFIEEGLFDPNLERYVPEALPSGLCFPMNDDAAKADLGCN